MDKSYFVSYVGWSTLEIGVIEFDCPLCAQEEVELFEVSGYEATLREHEADSPLAAELRKDRGYKDRRGDRASAEYLAIVKP